MTNSLLPLLTCDKPLAFRKRLTELRRSAAEVQGEDVVLDRLTEAARSAKRAHDKVMSKETRAGVHPRGSRIVTAENSASEQAAAQAEFQRAEAYSRVRKQYDSVLSRYNSAINQYLDVEGGPYLVSEMRVLATRDHKKQERMQAWAEHVWRSQHTEVMQAVMDNVDSLITRLPEPDPEPIPPRDRFVEVRAAHLLDQGQLDAYLDRMSKTRTKAQIQDAIGASKELMEAVYRAVAPLVGATVVLDDYPKTSKSVRGELLARCMPTRATAKTRKTLEELLKNAGTLDNRLAEVRNELGTGHGRASAPAGLKSYHAGLAIDLAEMQSRLVVGMMKDAGLL